MSSGRPPTLWCDLIVAASAVPDSITSGYKVPCTRNLASLLLAGHLLEDADEQLADRLALLLGVGQRRRGPAKKRSAAFTCTRSTANCFEEGRLDLLALAGAHEAGVDEDGRELVADRLVDERGRHGRVDAAREGAEHPAVADLGADRLRPATR